MVIFNDFKLHKNMVLLLYQLYVLLIARFIV